MTCIYTTVLSTEGYILFTSYQMFVVIKLPIWIMVWYKEAIPILHWNWDIVQILSWQGRLSIIWIPNKKKLVFRLIPFLDPRCLIFLPALRFLCFISESILLICWQQWFYVKYSFKSYKSFLFYNFFSVQIYWHLICLLIYALVPLNIKYFIESL